MIFFIQKVLFLKHKLYNTWYGMKDRCTNPNNKKYKNYGGRGIKVCDRWFNSFENFKKDMGPRPDGVSESGRPLYSIERINNNGDYEPNNCKWGTEKEQRRNKRNNRLIKINGELLSVADISERFNIPYTVVLQRVNNSKITENEIIAPKKEPKRYLLNGEYLPLTEIANKTGVKKSLLIHRLSKCNMTIEEAVDSTYFEEKRKIDFEGIKVSIKDLSRRFGISEESIRNRYSRGLRDSDLIEPIVKKLYKYKGRLISARQLAKIAGVKYTTMLHRLKNMKMSPEEAVVVKNVRRTDRGFKCSVYTKIDFNGQKLSLVEISKITGIPVKLLYSRFKRGKRNLELISPSNRLHHVNYKGVSCCISELSSMTGLNMFEIQERSKKYNISIEQVVDDALNKTGLYQDQLGL